MRSGLYPKGPIGNDARGRPLVGDLDLPGFCAIGLMATLLDEYSMPTVRALIGLSRGQVTKIQREWNDSPLSFAEIANRVEREMF